MQKRILPLTFIAFLFSLVIAGCSKLDTTDIGSDLLPAVDNVSTFDTVLSITTTQGVFADTTKVYNTDDQVLGHITNDPLFGTTQADVFAQFKPGFFPFYYGNAGDTIVGFDSVVLCLSYKGFWGDTSVPVQLQVFEVQNNTGGLWDSVYQGKTVNFAPTLTGGAIGTALVDVRTLGNYIKYTNGKDSVKNQIRIKLNSSFANALFTRDTLHNDAFKSDSLFRVFQNGLGIVAGGSGNGLIYTNLTDTSSKLEIHYRRKNTSGVTDTSYTALKITTSTVDVVPPSSTADHIVRNRPAQVSNPLPGEIYLQTSPGTYANLSIPALSTLSNRIVHRAELIVEQIPTNPLFDGIFSAPNFLYVDLKDTGATNKWKPLYFDLNPNTGYDPDFVQSTIFYPSGGPDFGYFGGFVRDKNDAFGNPIKYYNINITRYVQQIVTKHTPNYNLRLFAPYDFSYSQYATDVFIYNNKLAAGRVKVGGGTNANYKMRLRIVYSKI
ncbi:DUF4270 family protein [Ferruginibacter sp.]